MTTALHTSTWLDAAVFAVRSHPTARTPFVVVDLGGATVQVDDPAVVDRLLGCLVEARDLLLIARSGQAPLPVDPVGRQR